MNESSIMLLAGPGSAYGGNEFRGELDDNCNINLVLKVASIYNTAGIKGNCPTEELHEGKAMVT